MFWLNLLFVWVLCGFLEYGYALAYVKQAIPELAARERRCVLCPLAFLIILGPIGIVVHLWLGIFYRG